MANSVSKINYFPTKIRTKSTSNFTLHICEINTRINFSRKIFIILKMSSIFHRKISHYLTKFLIANLLYFFFPRKMVKQQFDVNVIGCWTMSKVFQPHLMASSGRIINMISFCTECPLPTLSVYTASKG